MNSKEIITIGIVLTVFLVGIVFLAVFNKPKGNTEIDANLTGSTVISNSDNSEQIDSAGLDDEISGFEKRAIIQYNQQLQNSNQAQQQTLQKEDALKNNQIQVTDKNKTMPKPQMILNENVDYQAIIKTSMGEIKVDLLEDETPITVNNFVYLSRQGFYDGLIFHRVIQDFMIQGGDPTGTGAGGPGYSFQDEINSKRPMLRGALAMANAGPNTNGSQFFIVTKEETPWLVKAHTNFGQVIEGLDVVMQIEKVPVNESRPVQNITIEKIEIIELDK